jgi:hypothetical protein
VLQSSASPAAPAPARRSSGSAAIGRAWRARQNRIDSASFHWTEVVAHRHDWIPNPLHADSENAADPALTRERTDTVSRALVISGNRIRVMYTDRHAVPGSRTVTDTTFTDWITQGGHIGDLVLRPVLLDVRPLDRNLGFRTRARTLAYGATQKIYRREALISIEEPADSGKWKHSLWLDPARDYVVRRHLLIHAADTMIEQTISYFDDPTWGWLPCRWVTLRRKSRPVLWQSSQARLTSFRINGLAGTPPNFSNRNACH